MPLDVEGRRLQQARVVAEEPQTLIAPLAQHLACRAGPVVVVQVLGRITADGTATVLSSLQVGDLARAQLVLAVEVAAEFAARSQAQQREPNPDADLLFRV